LQIGDGVENNPPYTPSNPNPANQNTNANLDVILSWTGGDPDGDPVAYDVYFGTASDPPQVSSGQSATTYDPGTLDYDITYYWKIVAWDDKYASTTGPVWEFTTEEEANTPPYEPSNPSPSDGATDVNVNIDLSWTGGDPDGDPVTYDVYFGTVTPPPQVSWNQPASTYDPGVMDYETTHYWKIVNRDNRGESTAGPIWDFTTVANNPPHLPSNPSPDNNATNVDTNADLSWSGGDPDGDPVTYDVYFGTASDPPQVSSGQSATNYDPGTLGYNDIYYWKIVAWDDDNKSAAGSLWSFTTRETPNNPPEAPVKPSGPTHAGIDLTIEYTTSTTDPDDDQMYYKWSWGDGNFSGWLGPFDSGDTCVGSYSWEKTGNYSIKVKARDIYYAEGGWSPSMTVTVLEIGPKADAGGPYVGFEDESIQFSGSATDGEEPYSWSWDFGDENGTSSQQNPTYIYDNPGEYIVSLTVTDSNEDSDTDYADVYVAQNGTLVVKSGGPYVGFTEETVEFTGSAIGGTPPYYWQWNFGDGDISDEQNPSHIYTDKGQYTVTFTVTDSRGLTGDDTTTATIFEREKDTTPPIADITNPEEGFLYLLNSKVIPSFRTWIIGRINIEVEAYDNESDIYSVEFYIDGDLKSTDTDAPYVWTWDENAFFQHVIKVVVYDDAGNYVMKEMIVRKFF